MSGLVDIRRYLAVGSERIDITDCFWCGSLEAICGLCAVKADEARRSQATARANESKAARAGNKS